MLDVNVNMPRLREVQYWSKKNNCMGIRMEDTDILFRYEYGLASDLRGKQITFLTEWQWWARSRKKRSPRATPTFGFQKNIDETTLSLLNSQINWRLCDLFSVKNIL